MMRVIKITLSGSWVLEHRNDEILPIKLIEKKLKDEYCEAVKIENSSLTELSFSILGTQQDELNETANKIKAFVEDLILKEYQLEPGNDIASYRIKDKEETDNSEDADKTTEEKKTPESTEQNAVEKCMSKINSLVGGENFKKLAKEILLIAPQITQNKTYDSFTSQSYLFSINDGSGLSTYLSSLAELLDAVGIKKIDKKHPVIEEKIMPAKGDSADAFSDLRRLLRNGDRDEISVLCIDISEWLNKLNDRYFKDFLQVLARNTDKYIVVFRVPYVDVEVLEKVYCSLNDIVFVRTITFPPFTNEELKECAKRELAKYDFKMTRSAWLYFLNRITEEKNDGSFYGLNTVQKVVRELLYKKQLLNAKKGKNDKLIAQDAAKMICHENSGNDASGYELLSRLVGSESIRNRIDEIISQIELSKMDSSLGTPCIHMRFVGNPGTGKTTVARIIGKILKEKGVLRVGNFYEYSGRDFCGRYIGETAPKTASMCRDAYGSVLFIDEAYSLYRGDDNGRDYGREALDTLIAEMENHRNDLVVIMAGYTDDMNRLMEGNAGLASRMPYVIEFPNFTREQLYEIYCSMLNKHFTYTDDLLPAVKEYFENLPEEIIQAKEFSNARFVRNLFERTWAKAALRCQLENSNSISLTKGDFERSVQDREFALIMQKKRHKIGFSN